MSKAFQRSVNEILTAAGFRKPTRQECAFQPMHEWYSPAHGSCFTTELALEYVARHSEPPTPVEPRSE